MPRKNSGWLMKLLCSFSILHSGLTQCICYIHMRRKAKSFDFVFHWRKREIIFLTLLYITHSTEENQNENEKEKRTSLWSGNVYKDSIDARTSGRRVGLGFIIHKYTRRVSSAWNLGREWKRHGYSAQSSEKVSYFPTIWQEIGKLGLFFVLVIIILF